MFTELTAQTQTPAAMFGMRGFGALAGAGDVVRVGTRIRLQANVQDSVGLDPWSLTENALESISRYLRQGGYRILNRWFDYYAGVSFEVEIGIEKVSRDAIENSDFYNSVKLGLTSYELTPYNVRSDILFDPGTQQQETPPRTVPPVVTTTPPPPGTNPPPAVIGSDGKPATAIDPNAPKGFLESVQAFLDKKFGFLGGTVSGMVLVVIGVGAILFLKRD